MIWIAFFVSVLYVCLGYGLATYYHHRRGPSGGSCADDSADELIASGHAQELLQSLHDLASHVHQDVGRHNAQVSDIGDQLRESGELTTTAVMAAAKRLLNANKQLHADLDSARRQIEYQQQELHSYIAEARTDPLTGLANRRAFEDALQRWHDRWERQETPLSLILIDIDHFKEWNDAYGHQAGDEVLNRAAAAMTQATRPVDVVTRYGGDEFAVLLPGMGLTDARITAKRIHLVISTVQVTVQGKMVPISLSIGVAATRAGDVKRDLVHRADAALYAAKNSGRDCIYAHTGVQCERVYLDQKIAERGRISIAPFVDGIFPEHDLFREVECELLNSSGFQFLLDHRPEFGEVLVALGEGKDRLHMSASIEDCLAAGTADDSKYLVRCRFTAPTVPPLEIVNALADTQLAPPHGRA